ncbi:MAG: tRNA preQ1(34) S-adenosylmethionine ribosyltransferase-isomerase QueA [Rhodobacter sp.]|nr:tRNA preQ1(34) S-adenosylmethionine ribosyltransferase-isomerase QueA [Rhodobacter sp.]MCY4241276.1 tRNA preQ1(34) S-adenosylmethionine ribosyltransferase-isomerase QueA [Rhodobacter sp.]
MKLSDFDFDLPDELIALRPARPRSSSRLLVAGPASVHDACMVDLPNFLRPGDRLVLNDTRVIPARLVGRRRRDSSRESAGVTIEVTLLGTRTDGKWNALVKPLRRLKTGDTIHFSDDMRATFISSAEGVAVLAFNLAGPEFDAALDACGSMPLPPYITAKRAVDEEDRECYQSVWAERSGSVAAPTASLHFDGILLKALEARGIATSRVTLHVGAGTFLPVRDEDFREHRLHAEWGEVREKAALEINATRNSGGRIIPVGTTALRLIESAATGSGRIVAWRGETDLFIKPGFGFQLTDGLLTNFHLPKSTLIILVAALMGRERLLAIYSHAIDSGYRFFSYGDASLLLPEA